MPPPVTGPQFNPLAIVSMILGILSIPNCCCVFVGAPFAIGGLALGIVAMQKIRASPNQWKGNGMAIAGIVTASIGILLSIAAIFSTIDDDLRGRYFHL